ncbi:MAG: protein phosphatase 2C domain-containing protein [Prevotella sp.]|jgi:serine/threonine protein phosphatase PrpC|nr:protein phosphatase 2C domain-containing protein [Prevotella sp.]
MRKITYTGKTDKGRWRSNNEDAFVVQSIWDDEHVLGIVIDGVGGYDGGERAAAIARETIVAYLEEYPNGERCDLLKQAVVEANNTIVEERNACKQFPNMSCVLTACLLELEKKRINMVHVGDTRLYQFRNNELKKLSHDHSLVGYREEIGSLTEEEAMNHPQRNLISRLVGDERHQADDSDFLEAAIFPLLPDTTLLLCSDGLSDMLTGAEIMSAMQQDVSLEEKADNLIQAANDKGGKDNITVVLIDYLCDEAQSEEPETVVVKATGEPIPPVIETSANNKKNNRMKTGVGFLLLGIVLGVAGCFIYSNLPDAFRLAAASRAAPPDTPKDTLIFKIDNTCAVRIIGAELKTDTISP